MPVFAGNNFVSVAGQVPRAAAARPVTVRIGSSAEWIRASDAAADRRPPLKRFNVEGVIPEGTHYVVGSARSGSDARFEGLVDGEDWQTEPAGKTTVGENGEPKRVRAEADDYRKIRWVLRSGALADKNSPAASTASGSRRIRAFCRQVESLAVTQMRQKQTDGSDHRCRETAIGSGS